MNPGGYDASQSIRLSRHRYANRIEVCTSFAGATMRHTPALGQLMPL